MELIHLSGVAPGAVTATLRHDGLQRRVVAEVARFGPHWSARRPSGLWSARCTSARGAILLEAADYFPGGSLDDVAVPDRVQAAAEAGELVG